MDKERASEGSLSTAPPRKDQTFLAKFFSGTSERPTSEPVEPLKDKPATPVPPTPATDVKTEAASEDFEADMESDDDMCLLHTESSNSMPANRAASLLNESDDEDGQGVPPANLQPKRTV